MSIYVAVLVRLLMPPPPPEIPYVKTLIIWYRSNTQKNNEKSVQDYEHKLNTKMKH